MSLRISQSLQRGKMGNKRRYTHSFLLTFILYCVAIALFVWGLSHVQRPVNLTKENSISLKHISLVEQTKKELQPQKQEPKPKKVVKPKEVKTSHPKEKVKKQRPTPIEEKPKEVKESKKEEAQEQEALKKSVKTYEQEFVDEHLRQIVMLIQKNIRYPKRARILKVQGRVMVEFTILSNGKLQNIQALEGHKLLIKSSLNAINDAAASFPKVKEQITLKVPIEYKLN